MSETGGAGRADHMAQQTLELPLRVDAGFTTLEILFALALSGTVLCVAVPSMNEEIDGLRTASAARYVAARLTGARIAAVNRSACVGLRFEPDGADYRFTPHADGNGNGIRTLDIALGIDRPIGATERLADKFPGVRTGLMNGYPDADHVAGTGADGVRLGTPRIATMSPDGTATGGTVYLHGRRSQFAVRILGTTGRVRVLQYQAGGGRVGHAVDDRRGAARFSAPLLSHLHATLRPGNAVLLVNLAAGGALVHSRRPLPPGVRVHVQIVGGPHAVRIAARVLRCGVASLSAADGAMYAGALSFDKPCELPWPRARRGR